MTMFIGIIWLLICTSLICFCNCQNSFVSVERRLEQLEEDLLDNKDDMIRMEKRIRNIIDAAKTSLRVELKETIRDLVRETMSEIVQGETFRDAVKSEVVSGLRHVKQGYHQMKKTWHHVSRSLKDFQDETTTFHEFFLKKIDGWKGQNTSDTCSREKLRLEMKLQKCNASVAELKQGKERLLALNKSCQFQISQLKTALSVPASQGSIHHVNTTSTSLVMTNLVTATRPSVLSALLTTPRLEVERSRILIAPLWSNTIHQFRQLSIYNNSFSVYQYHNLTHVDCMAYSAKTRELLIALSNPNRILASTLDTRQVRVMRKGVRTFGMAVDDGRGVVFMGTYRPKYSISRMSTQGENFTTVIDLTMSPYYPMQITLDTRTKKIYGCNYFELFSVTYDGQGLATLARGSHMYAVTLDQTAGMLYYSNRKELMRMTISNNVSTRVMTLRTRPMNMRLYRGVIYYGGWDAAVLGTVNVTNNTGAYSLESKPIDGFIYPHLCLIP